MGVFLFERLDCCYSNHLLTRWTIREATKLANTDIMNSSNDTKLTSFRRMKG